MISHKKKFGIYHWDTFDNVTLLIEEKDTLQEARSFISGYYGDRIRSDGADIVNIVDKKGNVVGRYTIG